MSLIFVAHRRKGRSRRTRRGDSASSRGSYGDISLAHSFKDSGAFYSSTKEEFRKSNKGNGASTYEDRNVTSSRQSQRRKKKRHRRLEEKTEAELDTCLPQISKNFTAIGQETPRSESLKVSNKQTTGTQLE